MHILHLIDGLGLGGAERMLVDLANQAHRDGHRVSVCITRNNTALRADLDPAIELVVLDRQRRFALRPLLRLSRWIDAHDVDVLHVHMRGSLALAFLLRAARLTRAPIVFHDHYGTIEVESSIPRWFRYGHRFISQYVGVHESLEAWARRGGVSPEKTRTIENRLDLQRLAEVEPKSIRTSLALPSDGLLGILVATVRRDKGIEVAIRAVAQAQHREQLRVVVVGTQPDESYMRECLGLAETLGVTSRVLFAGPRTDVPQILRGADFGLLTSHTESGPLVLIEYLAAALPIVSTRVGNVGRKLAALGVAGFVSPGDPAAVAAAIDELFELPADARRRRGRDGHDSLAHWDIKLAMSSWYDVYRAAIEAPR